MIVVRTKNTNTKISRDEMRFATKFMLWRIFKETNEDIFNEIKILVQNKSALENKDDKYHALTFCRTRKRSPRSFRIVLFDIGKKQDQLLTLAHELVHVKQFAMNELDPNVVFIGDNVIARWKNESINETEVDYYDLPYEIEAFGRQEGVVRRYNDFVTANQVKFKPD